MLGLRGHSAALMNPLKSSLLSVQIPFSASYSGPEMDGEGVAYSWTWLSNVKLLIDENDSRSGAMYAARAPSMSQSEGIEVGVNKENVR